MKVADLNVALTLIVLQTEYVSKINAKIPVQEHAVWTQSARLWIMLQYAHVYLVSQEILSKTV